MCIGPRGITRDELDTLFKEASSIINNTHFYQISVDPSDPFPICPDSLMLLEDNPNPPVIETFSKADLNSYGKLRWRRIQQIAEQFWHACANIICLLCNLDLNGLKIGEILVSVMWSC